MSLMDVVAALVVLSIGVSTSINAWCGLARCQVLTQEKRITLDALNDAAEQFLDGTLTTDATGMYTFVEGSIRCEVKVIDHGDDVQFLAKSGNQEQDLWVPKP